MASSGYFSVSTTNSNISGSVSWTSTNNDSANTSTVKVNMNLSRTNSGYTTSGSGTFTLVINGVTVSNSSSFSIGYNSKTLMVSGTVTVPHNPDGTKSIIISWSGSSNVFDVNSGSGTAVLDPIPRASTLSSGQNWTAPNDTTLYINRSSSSFTHNVKVYANNVLLRTYTGVATSVNTAFTTADNTTIFQQMNGAGSTSSKVTIDTYDGNTLIGSNSYTGTITAVSGGYATFSNFNIGDDVPATIHDYDSRLTYNARFVMSAFTKTFSGLTTGTPTFTWTSADDDSLYQQTPNSNSLHGDVYISQYYNGVQVRGETSSGFDCYVTNADPNFIDFNWMDTNQTTINITGSNQYIVQNQSSFQAEIATNQFALGQKYATITKYIATINGSSLTSDNPPTNVPLDFQFGAIDSATNQNISITVYDSRGNSTTVTKTVTILPYQPPIINATVSRTNGFEDSTTLQLNGSISRLSVAGVDKNSLNTANTSYKYAQSGGSYGANYAFPGLILTMPNYTASAVNLTLANTSAWTVSVTVTDQLTSTTSTYTVPVGTPLMFLDSILKSLGLGKFPTQAGAFETSGDIYENGTKLSNKYAPATPSGVINMYAGASANVPTGWLVCQGQAVSRTTYSSLFNAIGTTYGTGDGSTTFNLPNLQGKVPVGLDSAQTEFNTLGATGGEKTHTLIVDEMPSHNHDLRFNESNTEGTLSYTHPTGAYATQTTDKTLGFSSIVSTGGGLAHNNLQPYIVVNYIIKT